MYIIKDHKINFDDIIFKLSDILFLLSYLLIISAGMLSNVHAVSGYQNLMESAGNALLILLFILRCHKLPIKDMIIRVLTLIPLALSFYFSAGTEVLKLYFLVIAFQGMDFKKFVKFDLTIKVFLLLLVLCLYFAGFTDSFHMAREGGQLRSSMGFIHPNFFGAILLSICFSVYYLKFNEINCLYYSLFIAVILIIPFFSDSRTSQYALILLSLIHMLYTLSSKKLFSYKVVSFIFVYSFVIFLLISILLGYLYGVRYPFALYLDALFTERIGMIYRHMGSNVFP